MTQKIGKIISLEGTDASGKETQTKLLLDRLNSEGYPTELISFPTYNTPSGRIVGQCYLGKDIGPGDYAWFGDADSVGPKVASLYFAANRRADLPKIKKIIYSKKNLIFDRGPDSNKAHQGGKAKTVEERVKIIDFIDKLEYDLLGFPRSDLTIFLNMPEKIAQYLKQQTGEKLDSHESNKKHLKNARETFFYLKDKYNWIQINCAQNETIESLKSPQKIHEEIYSIVKEII